jgi:uncharacterized protein (TIGR03083 family)
MTDTPPYAELLTLVDDRSAALRAAVTAAPDRAARVPGCPDWTLDDLVRHLGAVQRFWAAALTAADASGPPTPEQIGDQEPHGDLPAWSAESTRLLLDAFRAADPASPCWAWWTSSGASLTAAAVARHQVQEAAVHAFDAQQTIGRPEPLPAAIAVDGVAEFLSVPLASLGPWPHRPARVSFTAVEGPAWTVDLSPSGTRLNPPASGEPVSTMHAPASDLVLALYRRIPLNDVRLDGDREVIEQLRDWTTNS